MQRGTLGFRRLLLTSSSPSFICFCAFVCVWMLLVFSFVYVTNLVYLQFANLETRKVCGIVTGDIVASRLLLCH